MLLKYLLFLQWNWSDITRNDKPPFRFKRGGKTEIYNNILQVANEIFNVFWKLMGEIEFVYSISNRVFCSHKFLTFLLARICVCVCVCWYSFAEIIRLFLLKSAGWINNWNGLRWHDFQPRHLFHNQIWSRFLLFHFYALTKAAYLYYLQMKSLMI